MKKMLIFLLVLIGQQTICRAQAVFQSAFSGDWNAPASWTLISGTSTDNYPVAGDEVSISSGHIITVAAVAQCGQVTMNDAAQLVFNSNTSVLTVAGSFTQSAAATVHIIQGSFSVVGLYFLNAPTSIGTTLLDVQGGAFSCAGGMSITGVSSSRTAELRIGNSLVNIIGGLAAITANARINFTGTGSLSLAGLINISNAASFIRGNGRVIYVGIPGSDQVIAPLTYCRLAIAGLGGGIKRINGAVTVTDTLSLINDSLMITGGSLTMQNQSAIVRTQGKLFSAPVFSGVVDIIYNNVFKDTTGAEMPVAGAVLRNLTINNIGGVELNSNITVNNSIRLIQGPLITGTYTVHIANAAGGLAADPAVERNNGYILGSLTRAIGNSTGIRSFPLGIGNVAGYRGFDINYIIAPDVAGTLAVQHFNTAALSQSGVPLNDAGLLLTNVAPMYWQAIAQLGLTGGTYTLSLYAEGISGVADVSLLRIIKRAADATPWTLNGSAGVNSGTITAPVVVRTGMSGFSQFAISGNSSTLPLSVLSFTADLQKNKALLQWITENEINSSYFSVESSTNGSYFSEEGRLIAAGISTAQRIYAFTDAMLNKGMNYYRIRQVNADGQSYYSKIIALQYTGALPLEVYPSVTTGILQVEADSRVYISNAGTQIIRELKNGQNNITDLPAGIYFVLSGSYSIRIIKQ